MDKYVALDVLGRKYAPTYDYCCVLLFVCFFAFFAHFVTIIIITIIIIIIRTKVIDEVERCGLEEQWPTDCSPTNNTLIHNDTLRYMHAPPIIHRTFILVCYISSSACQQIIHRTALHRSWLHFSGFMVVCYILDSACQQIIHHSLLHLSQLHIKQCIACCPH